MDVLNDSILIYNLPFTLFLGLQLVYWLFVIIGALDIEIADGLLGAGDGADVSIEAEANPDADIDFSNHSLLSGLLDFFYFKKVPVIILTSIWTLAGWATSMILNTIFNSEHQVLLGMLMYIPCFFAGLMAVKIFGLPLSKLFISLENDPDDITSATGSFCTMITSVSPNKVGVAKVNMGKAMIQINVVTHSDMHFKKGEKAVVIERNAEKNEYLIDKITHELKEK